MRILSTLAAMALLAGCASTSTKDVVGPGKDLQAVRDFVAVGDLTEVDKVRLKEQLKYWYVNDWYVVLPQRQSYHLIQFRGRCDELRRRQWTSDMVDMRVHSRHLYSDHDTIRGCVIGHIYELSDPQLEELRVLGDAPGREDFLSLDEEQ